MKRNMDLMRKILIAAEESPDGFAPRSFEIDGYTWEQVGYHVHLMNQAGLVEAADVTHRGNTGPEAVLRALTWEGHEFLEAARRESLWERAKSFALEKTGGLTIAAMRMSLEMVARDALGETGSES